MSDTVTNLVELPLRVVKQPTPEPRRRLRRVPPRGRSSSSGEVGFGWRSMPAYYAFATVRHTPEPGAFETNHWVLYAGLRTSWRDGSIAGSRSGSYELLVSDSSRTKPHEEWFEMGEHLKGRGGFAVMLARPTQR